MKNLEHLHQAALFRWAALNTRKYPELDMLLAIPNGGLRHIGVARKLKAEGVKAGVPDVCLPVPRGTNAGLWIELKAGKNKPTPEQEGWLKRLREHGHRAEVAYGWEAARDIITKYLNSRQATKPCRASDPGRSRPLFCREDPEYDSVEPDRRCCSCAHRSLGGTWDNCRHGKAFKIDWQREEGDDRI